MKINALSSNKQTFGSVNMSPSKLTLNVVRNNINEAAVEELHLLQLKHEYAEKWDMLISGYNGKLNFQAILKDGAKKLHFYILGINPINKEKISQNSEFQADVLFHNSKKKHKILNFKFNNADEANKAYSKLCENYQTFDKIRMQNDFDSNLNFIRIADENFSIIKNAETTEIAIV